VLRWAPAARALLYEVKTEPKINGATCSGQTLSLSFVCEELPPGTYTWSVRAIGLHGVNGDFSAPRTFVKLARLSTAPTVLAPATGATFQYPDEPSLLGWSAVSTAAGYQVQISTDPAFPGSLQPSYGGGPILLDASPTATSALAPATDFGVTKHWRVRAVTSPGVAAGPWSAARSFVVQWVAPVVMTPASGATVGAVVLVWQWQLGATSYVVELDDDPAFGSPFIGFPTSPAMSWGTVPAPGTWHWRVHGISADGGASPWSATRTLILDPAGAPPPPAPDPVELTAPTLTSPTDGLAAFEPQRDILDWEPVEGTRGYDVQIVPVDAEFYDNSGQPDTLRTEVVPLLDAGTTYKWRVRANRTQGVVDVGPWSEVRTFTTIATSTVTLTSPANGVTRPHDDLWFSWSAVPDAPNYYVELSQAPDFASPTWIRVFGTPTAVYRNKISTGLWYWRVRAGRDSTLAVSEVRTLTVVDLTPPVGRIGDPPGYTLADTILLPHDAEDANGWVVQAAASADGVDWLVYDFETQPAWSLVSEDHGGPGEGLRELWMKWQDDAGNWSAPSRHAFWYGYPDPAPPDGTVVIAGGAAAVPASDITLDLAADDTDLILSVALSNDGVAWTTLPYSPTLSWTLASGEGTRTVYAKWMDLVEHWSPVESDTVMVDLQAPIAQSFKINDGAAQTGSSSVALELLATDSGSGVVEMALSNNGTAWTIRPYSTSQVWTLAAGEGPRTVWARFRDAVGRWSSPISDSIVVDLPAVTDRQAGANRYATAAEISKATFSPGVPVAYVATGANFPDALAAAAAAGHLGGPVLLVTATSIPAETAAELDRLNPGRIVVAGGSSVVSNAVLSALQAY